MSQSPIDARFSRLEAELRQQGRDFAHLALALDDLRSALGRLSAPCPPSHDAPRPRPLERHGVCRVIPFRGCCTEGPEEDVFTRVN